MQATGHGPEGFMRHGPDREAAGWEAAGWEARAALGMEAAVRSWLDSFGAEGGRCVAGVRGAIWSEGPRDFDAEAGRLVVDGVTVEIEVGMSMLDERERVDVTASTRTTGLSEGVTFAAHGGGRFSAPGVEVLLDSGPALTRALDAAIVPLVVSVAARHKVTMLAAAEAARASRRPDGADDAARTAIRAADGLFSAGHAEAEQRAIGAYGVVAGFAGSLARDLERLPQGAPARCLLEAATRLRDGARVMAGDDGDDGFAGDPEEREPPAAAEPAPAAGDEVDVDGPHALYDPGDARRALRATAGDREASTRNAMLARLCAPTRHPGRRRLGVADAAAVAAIAGLKARAPHFGPVADLVAEHAGAAVNAGVPLSLPPLLLVGEGGVGKTWFLSRVGRGLGLPFRDRSLSGSSLADMIQGSHGVYRNSHAGLVAETLIEEDKANPLLFVDEFDKPQFGASDPYRPFYVLLEPDGARRFVDEFLGVPFDASRVNWVMAANDLSRIPEVVLDRMTVIEVPRPDPEQMAIVARSIARGLNASRFSGYFEDGLAEGVVDALSSRHPRGARRALEAAMVRAAAAGRRAVRADDLPSAEASRRNPIGFGRR